MKMQQDQLIFDNKNKVAGLNKQVLRFIIKVL